MTRSSAEWMDAAYEILTTDEEGRACADIPEEACREAPGNFFLNALNGAATKLGDQLASPGLVLPWFLDSLGAPAWVIGALTPVRRAGALVPQLAVAGQIRQYERRKWFWLAGGLGFGIALALMVPSALLLPPLGASILILILLGLGSLARGISSVAFKDVLGKTIPRGKRGSLLALRATVGGLLALAAGLYLRLRVGPSADITPFLFMVGFAGALWIMGVSLIAFIHEEPGATGGGRNALQEAHAGIRLLREQPGFQRFMGARAILLTIELSLPFYAVFARRFTGGQARDLGIFVIAASLAQVLSSPFWGRFADRSSRIVMAVCAALAVSAGVFALLLAALAPDPILEYALTLPVLLIGFARSGVRLSRKTYLVDATPVEDQPTYVALSNTLAGVLILLGGGFGLLAEIIGVPNLIALFTGLAIGAVAISWRLPEAEKMLTSGG